jgi:magnesium chelatase subunit I
MGAPFPFAAIVGQDDMKLAFLIAAVDPSVGGVLVFGDRGTGKSTAVRGLADLLPRMRVVVGCPYNCDPAKPAGLCVACNKGKSEKIRAALVPVPVVDLPLGATEDRVVGALDLERALASGKKRSSRAYLQRPTGAFCISTKRTCSKIIWSTFCLMSPPPAKTSSSGRV